jgi:Ca2+-binding RTX toxin-like protein
VLRLGLRSQRDRLENRCGPQGPPRARIPPLGCQIAGRGGNDELDGDSGSDQLDGGADADTIHATDGAMDTIACDAADTRNVDPVDLITGCAAPPSEPTGTLPAEPTGTSTTEPTSTSTTSTSSVAAPALRVRVLKPTARSRRRGVRVRVRSSAPATATVRLRVSRRTARRLALKRTLVGRARVDVEAGQARVLVIRVNRRALGSAMSLRARAVDASGQASRTVTLRVARR